MVGKIDLLYDTDNLVASSMPIVSKIATENKIPVIAAGWSVEKGALVY